MDKNTKVDIIQIPALKMLNIRVPQKYIDGINDYIDNVIIPANKSFADGLVGQLSQDKRSAQLTIPLDDDFGKKFKRDLEEVANLLVQSDKGFNRNAKAEAFLNIIYYYFTVRLLVTDSEKKRVLFSTFANFILF